MKRNNISKIVLSLFASLALVITGATNNKTQHVVEAEDSSDETEQLKTVTYTVATVSSVTTSGTAMDGSTVTFKNTYSTKDQLTASNSATLTISGITGYTIKGIVLNMHANLKKGAGTFLAKAGSTTLASIATGTEFNKWYDNVAYGTNYRDVNVTMTNSDYIIGAGESLEIKITATANSLYIQSFTLTYDYQEVSTDYGKAFEKLDTKSQLKLGYSSCVSEDSSSEVIGYTKVTSNLDDYSGKYIIVYENNDDAYVFNGKDENNGYVKAAIIDDNFIEATESVKAVEVTIEQMEGGYSIKTNDGYMYGESGNNGILFDKDPKLNTISYEENELTILSFTDYLMFNSTSNQMRFRYYKNKSQKPVSLYKLDSKTIYDTIYDIESTSLRFGTTISKDLYDGLVAEGTNVTFGVISQVTSVLGENELTVENAGNTKALTPVRVDTELASEESATGNYYQFAVSFTGITAVDYATEVTARCYVCIDGTYYYMQSKTCSVKTLAADYLTDFADNEQVFANSGVLTYLKNYTVEA